MKRREVLWWMWIAFAALSLAYAMMLSCAGCAQTASVAESPPTPAILLRTIPTFITTDFSDEDDVEILRAVSEWNTVLRGHVVFHVESLHSKDEEADAVAERRGVIFMRVPLSYRFMPIASPMAYAWTDRLGGSKVYVVRDRIMSSDFKGIMMHELGHVLGATDRFTVGLMYYARDPRFDWSCADRETADEVSRYFNIENDLLYCTRNKQ